jgi:hypothetical protein
MRCGFWSKTKRGIRAEHGAVAVEFAIICPVLLLLVFGIMDFGHYWYMGHVMSDASREGARYGTRFTGKLPGALSPSISDHVLVTSGSAGLLPSDANPTVTPTGPALAANIANLAGKDLVITVTATKIWWVLGSLIPGLGSSKLLTVKTIMTCE